MAEAYRTIPVRPSQWPGLVVMLREDDEYAINTNNNFGLASAGGVYGRLADCAACIFRANGLGPLSKWVDDHIFFRIRCEYLSSYNLQRQQWHQTIMANGGQKQRGSRLWYEGEMLPDGSLAEFDEDASCAFSDLSARSPRPLHDASFTYSDADIDALSEHLGIPWEPTKTVPFGEEVPYLGFIWNLATRSVSIPEGKKTKYLNAIQEWSARRTHTLNDVEKLYGKLLHASMVIPEGRAYLTSLESMLGTFSNNSFATHHPHRDSSTELAWWSNTLASPYLGREIPGPRPVTDRAAFSDASSGIGIGIVIQGKWRAWCLIPGWKCDGRDIGWAEAVGFEFLVYTLSTVLEPGEHFRVYGDNRGVVEEWWKGRSRNKRTNEVFRRIHTFLRDRNCTVITRYVPSKDNPADDPSRGKYPSHQHLLPAIPIPVELQEFIIDFDKPLLPAELELKRRGNAPTPLDKPQPHPNRGEPGHSWDEYLEFVAQTKEE